MQRPRLRDNKSKKLYELYPVGCVPDASIYQIGKWMAYYFAVGKSDISTDIFTLMKLLGHASVDTNKHLTLVPDRAQYVSGNFVSIIIASN